MLLDEHHNEPCAKALIFGDHMSGMSSLWKALFTAEPFTQAHNQTIGNESLNATLTHDDIDIKLQCWDMSGAENFQPIVRSYFPTMNVFVLCVDLSSEDFDEEKLNTQLQHIRDKTKAANYQLIVVGTKSDIAKEENITRFDKWLAQNELDNFVQTSAKTPENIDILKEKIAEAAYFSFDRSKKEEQKNIISPLSTGFFKSCPVNKKWLSAGTVLTGAGLAAAGIATMATIGASPWFILLLGGVGLFVLGMVSAMKYFNKTSEEQEHSYQVLRNV